MNCVDCEGQHKLPWAIIQILFFIGIFLMITVYIWIVSVRYYYNNENLQQYRCNPLFMPFISLFNPSIRISDNFNYCIGRQNKAIFKDLSNPIVNISNKTQEQLDHIQQTVQQAQKSTAVVASTVTDSITDAYDKYDTSTYVFKIVTLKLKAFFDKIGALLMDIYYSIITLFDLTNVILTLPKLVMNGLYFIFVLLVTAAAITSLMLVIAITIAAVFKTVGLGYLTIPYLFPIGIAFLNLSGVMTVTIIAGLTSTLAYFTATSAIYGLVVDPLKKMYDQADKASYCCFSQNTPILLYNNSKRCIKDVKVGDFLKYNVRVLGCLRAISYQRDWYLYGEHTYVSAEHLVYEHSCSIPIKNSTKAKYVGEYDSIRYCLVTSTHSLYTSDGAFSDFQQWNHKTEGVNNALRTLSLLNNLLYINPSSILQQYEQGECGLGLFPETYVLTVNGYKMISTLNLHDELESDNYILGIYECSLLGTYGIELQIGEEEEKVWLPCHQIVYHDSVWMKAYHIDPSLKNKCNVDICKGIHFITSKGHFQLKHNIIIRDFTEIPDRVI